MKRPIAYVTGDWNMDDIDQYAGARNCCRTLYYMGYAPLCPFMFGFYLEGYADDDWEVAQQHLRRADLLVVCGKKRTTRMLTDVAIAKECKIITTTFDGILAAQM